MLSPRVLPSLIKKTESTYFEGLQNDGVCIVVCVCSNGLIVLKPSLVSDKIETIICTFKYVLKQ